MDTIKVVNYIICKYRVWEAQTVYCVYEPYGGHSSTFTIEGVSRGKLGTRSLPEWLDKLPSLSAERSIAVKAYHQSQYQLAYALIYAVYPELATAQALVIRDGEIVQN